MLHITNVKFDSRPFRFPQLGPGRISLSDTGDYISGMTH